MCHQRTHHQCTLYHISLCKYKIYFHTKFYCPSSRELHIAHVTKLQLVYNSLCQQKNFFHQEYEFFGFFFSKFVASQRGLVGNWKAWRDYGVVADMNKWLNRFVSGSFLWKRSEKNFLSLLQTFFQNLACKDLWLVAKNGASFPNGRRVSSGYVQNLQEEWEAERQYKILNKPNFIF